MGDPSLAWPDGHGPDADDPTDRDPPTPNMQQARLIQTTQGTVLVDAGAGTGKTFTIAHRYLHLLDAEGLAPEDVLLITFTRNAAEEMRERILHLGELSPGRLREAPISTFHALAKRIIEQHGFDAPAHLGRAGRIAPGFSLVEDDVRERELFEAFLRGFRDAHPEHADRFAAMHDPTNLLDLLRELAAKGIFPTREAWYRDGREALLGDREAYLARFSEANQTDGSSQSEVREALNRYDRDRLHLPHAPTKQEIRGPDGTKQVDQAWAEDAFDADREALIAFVHDVYVAYLEHALDRNYLNFQFLLLFAYVLLVEDDALRDRLQFDQVMIDEFQDTSEIQLQLALLFCAEPNLCCVGDWKQSIYSFQYADVDNIRRFDERVARHARRLNEDRQRVPPAQALTPADEIPLRVNYRSTQPILDVAKEALVTPATKRERLDEAAIREATVDLESTASLGRSRIEAITSDDEIDAVLAKIQAIVGDEAYPVEDETADEDGVPRVPTHGDVAVLTRTRSFALELTERAREIGLPMAFEGGVEVYKTDPGKLLLAWLRLVEDARSDRGLALVLDAAGYTLDEAERILDTGEIPDGIRTFREHLARLAREASLGAVARAVFDRYGLHDGFTEALIKAVEDEQAATRKTLGEIVRTLEDKLAAGTTEPVDENPGGDVVTVQTIHAAKGLEYPIVILADVNEARFPSTGGGYPSVVRYQQPVGLRASKVYAEPDEGPAYVYDDWRYTVLRSCLSSTDHDEERRLFYVAMSRAEQHLVLTATTSRPSRFFEEIPIEAETIEPRLAPVTTSDTERPPPVPVTPSQRSSPQGLPIGELVPEPEIQATGGRGRVFGRRLHGFAARYAMGEDVTASTTDEEHAKALVDALSDDARLEAEIACTLPVDAAGQRVVLEGKIDLLAVDETTGRVDVVDWKTTPTGEGLAAYRRQVGLYAAIAQAAHPDKQVRGWVVYTEDGHREAVDPLPLETVDDLVRERLGEEAPGPGQG